MGKMARASLDSLDDKNQEMIDNMLNLQEQERAEFVGRLDNIATGMDWLHERINTSKDRLDQSNEVIKNYLPGFKERVDKSAQGIITILDETETGGANIKSLIANVSSEISEMKEKFPEVKVA
jgi:uncharacterized protein YaaN involved in tellurite resistance